MLCWKRVMCWMDLSAVGVIVDRTTRPPPTVPRIAEHSGIILDDERRLSHSATAITALAAPCTTHVPLIHPSKCSIGASTDWSNLIPATSGGAPAGRPPSPSAPLRCAEIQRSYSSAQQHAARWCGLAGSAAVAAVVITCGCSPVCGRGL